MIICMFLFQKTSIFASRSLMPVDIIILVPALLTHPRLLDLIPNESYEQRLGGLREQLRKLDGQAGPDVLHCFSILNWWWWRMFHVGLSISTKYKSWKQTRSMLGRRARAASEKVQLFRTLTRLCLNHRFWRNSWDWKESKGLVMFITHPNAFQSYPKPTL